MKFTDKQIVFLFLIACLAAGLAAPGTALGLKKDED